ncbi:MAG: hypothetical protein EPN73_20705 [Paraburkholderia sp.]|nr:MAG: hypothetical protein EPN73_20705 [Paraburkholderia sp.]
MLAFPCVRIGLVALPLCGAGFCFFVFWLEVSLAFPCFAFGLLASPLCGAAPTFLCLAKEK